MWHYRAERRFLFLQGPHGPFFHRLAPDAARLGAPRSGASASTGATALFWPERASYIAYAGDPEAWPDVLRGLIARHGHHRHRRSMATPGRSMPRPCDLPAPRGLTVHVFEEGYLRPYWVTYERGGVERPFAADADHARPDAGRRWRSATCDLPDAPARWGDMRQHVFWGALYHWFVLTGFRRLPQLPPAPRDLSVGAGIPAVPAQAGADAAAPARTGCWPPAGIKHGGFPYHLVLLQLEHDASFRMHCPFASMTEFLTLCDRGLCARRAPTSPPGVQGPSAGGRPRAASRAKSADWPQTHGVAERVHFVRGGKLAQLLNDARSRRHGQFDRGPAGAVARPAAEAPSARRSMPSPSSSRPSACPISSPHPTRPDSRAYRDFRHYPAGNIAGSGRFLLGAGPARSCCARWST